VKRPTFTGMPLRRKLIALLLVAAAMPMLATILLMSLRSQSFLRQQAIAVLESRGDQLAGELDGFNEQYRGVASRISANSLLRRFILQHPNTGQAREENDLRENWNNYLRSEQRSRGVALFDLDGRQRLGTTDLPLDPDIARRAYFRDAAAGTAVISDLFVATMAPEPTPVIAFASPVRDTEGKTAAVVVLYVRGSAFWDAVRAANGRAGVGSFSVLYDQYGIRIAHSFHEQEIFRAAGALSADVIEAQVAEKRFGERTRALLESPSDMQGEFVLARRPTLDHLQVFKGLSLANNLLNFVVPRRLRTVPWTLFFLVPVASIEEPIDRMAASSAAGGAVLIAVALLIGLGVVGGILRPIRGLAAAANALREGHLHTRAPVLSQDEVGTLAVAFNAMADSLLADRDHLEQKVRERTIDLEHANDELHAQKEELIAQREELKAQQREVQRKNQEISRADRLKSEFLANMSHELRTPLNSIIGFSELMLDPETADPDEQAIHLQTILSSGRHLLALINDILDLSKIEAGHASLTRNAVAPAELLSDACALIAPAAAKKRLTITQQALAQRAVEGDSGKLRQITLNLLSNAVKFSPEGATILVTTENSGTMVRFRVSDQGPGIEPALLERLFEPFVQGESSLLKKHQGTGLGLAISKRLVELHGGSISVESSPGGGATFSFTIPAVGPATVLARPDTTNQPLVMVIDGDPRSLGQLRARLESGGYRVLQYDNGRDVAAVAAEVHPAAIVFDPATDRRDGIRLLDDLARREETRDIPVVMSHLHRANLLAKPVEGRHLLHQLRRLIARGQGSARPLVYAIDDDPRVLALLEAVLAPAGYDVRGFPDPRAGLAASQSDPPDLLIVDLVMPGLSGFEVIEAFSTGERTRGRPIVVLTAADLSDSERERLRKYVRWLAGKGNVTEDDLLAAVHDAIQAKTLSDETPAGASDASTAGRILVVDDSDANRALACSILHRRGYRTLTAVDGESGIELARRELPALILMDLAMPGKDGYTAAREIKADPKTAHIPIVAVTALAMSGDERRAFDAGVDGYVTKPLDRKVLEETVARLLTR